MPHSCHQGRGCETCRAATQRLLFAPAGVPTFWLALLLAAVLAVPVALLRAPPPAGACAVPLAHLPASGSACPFG
jgi:hypothetical protein